MSKTATHTHTRTRTRTRTRTSTRTVETRFNESRRRLPRLAFIYNYYSKSLYDSLEASTLLSDLLFVWVCAYVMMDSAYVCCVKVLTSTRTQRPCEFTFLKLVLLFERNDSKRRDTHRAYFNSESFPSNEPVLFYFP